MKNLFAKIFSFFKAKEEPPEERSEKVVIEIQMPLEMLSDLESLVGITGRNSESIESLLGVALTRYEEIIYWESLGYRIAVVDNAGVVKDFDSLIGLGQKEKAKRYFDLKQKPM